MTPPDQSTGAAREAAQPGDFRRYSLVKHTAIHENYSPHFGSVAGHHLDGVRRCMHKGTADERGS